MDSEQLVLTALIGNDTYTRKVTPYLNKLYFKSKPRQIIYSICDNYFRKYNKCASADVITIELDKLTSVNEQLFTECTSELKDLVGETLQGDTQWLIDTTEEFVKDRALYNALTKAIEIANGNEKKLSKTAIPQIMQDALAIDFQSNLGHDYERDSEEQFKYYHDEQVRIPFGIQMLDDITNNGPTRKTLSILVAGTHVGKSLNMCAIACSMYLQGTNLLYITLEESEQKIRQRFDANMLDISMDELIKIDEAKYYNKLGFVKKHNPGILKVKEYPTKGASALTFKSLLEEYKIKENFIPDVIFIDYLNICASDNCKDMGNTNTYLKSVTEELRALAKSSNSVIITGSQLNRGGAKDSDPSMTDVADGFASLFVADFVAVLSAPEELIQKGLIMWNQQKNRFKNLNFRKRFTLGVDSEKMRVYDVEDSAQPMLHIDSDIPVFDTSNTGQRLRDKQNSFREFN